ncbi:MAG TPA: flagellar biosynthesis protein FliQ [Alphaproteobacteria bacterium]|nr:flagellar biosynthesis protein FliQ [Alphaproteobacteria bacterium]
MDTPEVLDIARETIIVVLEISAPILLLGLLVGVVISLVQALTQIQEQTLAFVPKLVTIFVSLLLFLPFMLTTLTNFTERLVSRIGTIG